MRPFAVLIGVAAGAWWFRSRSPITRTLRHSAMGRRTRAMLHTQSTRRIPLALKIGYTVFVAVLVPVYTPHYGLANFLWFSNIALFGGLAAVWLENRWLASMQVVSVSILELFWIGDFLAGLMTGESPSGLTAYMFDAGNPLAIRALSLYHVVLPFLLLWVVYRLGYERRAWIAQSFLAAAILLICYAFTDPSDNINWAFGPGEEPQTRIAPAAYLALAMLVFSACVYLPTHWILSKFYGWLNSRTVT